MKIKRIPLGPLWTNGYLVSDENGVSIFIDPAAPTEQKHAPLKAALLTHGHIDHIAGLSDAEFDVGGEVYIHEKDSKMLTEPDPDFGHRLGFDFRGVPSVKAIRDADELRFGSLKVQVIETPGHTQGSVCFLVSDENVPTQNALFSGDTLFAESVGRTDLEGGDEGQLMESLEILKKLPGELEVFPGHGPTTTISDEIKKNPFM